MAQSIGRKIKRNRVIPYMDGLGNLNFMHLKKYYRYFIPNFSMTNYKNKVDPKELLICNQTPIKHPIK